MLGATFYLTILLAVLVAFVYMRDFPRAASSWWNVPVGFLLASVISGVYASVSGFLDADSAPTLAAVVAVAAGLGAGIAIGPVLSMLLRYPGDEGESS